MIFEHGVGGDLMEIVLHDAIDRVKMFLFVLLRVRVRSSLG